VPNLERHHRIHLNAEEEGVQQCELNLVWFVSGPAGAVALDVHLTPAHGPADALGLRAYGERQIFAGRHSYVRLTDSDGYRAGECDLLEHTTSCWFSAFDTWGRELWLANRDRGAEGTEAIFAGLEEMYAVEFNPPAVPA
jgi:hypothetical protein